MNIYSRKNHCKCGKLITDNAKRCKSCAKSGINHPNYGKRIKKKCKVPLLKAIKSNTILNRNKYRNFRLKAMERDNYTCQKCNKKGNIVHHKKPRKLFPKMCFWFSNVITLCRGCHNSIHNKLRKDK